MWAIQKAMDENDDGKVNPLDPVGAGGGGSKGSAAAGGNRHLGVGEGLGGMTVKDNPKFSFAEWAF